MAGVPVLREAIAAKIEALYGHRYDPGEITVTAGRRRPSSPRILAIVHPGDEVIVLDPATTATAQHRAGRRPRGACR